MNTSSLLGLALAVGTLVAWPAGAQEAHPMLDSRVWVSVGEFFPERNLAASAKASFPGAKSKNIDFERALGMDDAQQLGTLEFGWQFSENWALSTQHFRSGRDAGVVAQIPIEWRDLVFDVGVELRSRSNFDVNRFVLSRQFRDRGPHSLRLAAGFHYLDVGLKLAGEATLEDNSVEYRREIVSAAGPVPNVGVWYRYSKSERLLISARVDWLSASVGDISGRIWNVSVSANYSLGKHVGIGLAYQFFELNGATHEKNWRGNIVSRFNGPNLQLSMFW